MLKTVIMVVLYFCENFRVKYNYYFFLKRFINFTQQCHIKVIKSGSKDIYNVRKDFIIQAFNFLFVKKS